MGGFVVGRKDDHSYLQPTTEVEIRILISQIKSSPPEHMHQWSFTQWIWCWSTVEERTKGQCTWKERLPHFLLSTVHIVAHLLIATSLLVKDEYRSRIDATTMQWDQLTESGTTFLMLADWAWVRMRCSRMPATGIYHLMVCQWPLVMSPWMSENPATFLPSVIL